MCRVITASPWLMGMCMAQMGRTRWVPPPDGTLLKVPLQNIRSRKSVLTQNTLIRPISGMSQKMPFEMLGVKVCFRAVRARVFTVMVFERCDLTCCPWGYLGVLRTSSRTLVGPQNRCGDSSRAPTTCRRPQPFLDRPRSRSCRRWVWGA